MTYGVTFTGKHARTRGRVRELCLLADGDRYGAGIIEAIYGLGWYDVRVQTILAHPADQPEDAPARPACPHCGIPHADPCPLELRRWDQR